MNSIVPTICSKVCWRRDCCILRSRNGECTVASIFSTCVCNKLNICCSPTRTAATTCIANASGSTPVTATSGTATSGAISADANACSASCLCTTNATGMATVIGAWRSLQATTSTAYCVRSTTATTTGNNDSTRKPKCRASEIHRTIY